MKTIPRKDLLFVGIQLVLFVCYILPLQAFDSATKFSAWIETIGLFFAIVGLLAIALAMLQLNKNLTPFPTPKDSGTLIQTGIFKFVRHPIYSGIILATLGFGVQDSNAWKIAIGLCLWVLFHFKSTYEESLLERQFDQYSNYKKATGRFFPFV